MNNNKRIKKVLLIITTIILFFSFNINVNAADKKNTDKSGRCTYNNPKKKSISIELRQDKDGKITHYYKKEGGKWTKLKGTSTKIVDPKDNITDCPHLKIYEPSLSSGYYPTYKHVVEWCHMAGLTYAEDCRTANKVTGIFDKQHKTDGNKKYQEGECKYSNNLLEITVKQDKNGKITYKYDKSKNVKLKNKPKKGSLTKCPTTVSITKTITSDKITVNFNTANCTAVKGGCLSPKGSGNFEKKEQNSNSNSQKYEPIDDKTNDDLFLCDSGDEDCKDYRSCQEILGEDLVEKIQEIVNIIRIMVPILLIVFGTLDFGKAIFSGDENEMKKAQSRFIKRLIVAIGFFIIPSILQLLLDIGAKVWNIQDPSFCGIKF